MARKETYEKIQEHLIHDLRWTEFLMECHVQFFFITVKTVMHIKHDSQHVVKTNVCFPVELYHISHQDEMLFHFPIFLDLFF